MRIFRYQSPVPKEIQNAAIAIGNFDGVHIGHASLIKEAGKIAANKNIPFSILTFEPHPKSIFLQKSKPFRITPFRTKVQELKKLGLHTLIIKQFNNQFSNCTAENFVKKILVEELNANHIIAGSDFVFGHNRAGGCDLLFKMGAELGFSFTPINPIESIEKKVYSSTNIRKYLELGALHKVKMNLGRYYSIQGRIAHGDKLGRKLGFPTANIFLGDHIRPKYGVYAVHLCFIDDSKKGSVNGVANIGIRPTIGGNNELLEVFIFNFKENIYGQRVKVDLIEYLRPEIKFNNLELMVAEMKRDIKRAKNLLKTKSND